MLAGRQRDHEVRPSCFMLPSLKSQKSVGGSCLYIWGQIYVCVGSKKCLEHCYLVRSFTLFLQLVSTHVARSWTQLSDFTFNFHFHALEKEMASHSSVIAWRIPGAGEPGGLPSIGVAQSRTWLKRLSSSSSSFHNKIYPFFLFLWKGWLTICYTGWKHTP